MNFVNKTYYIFSNQNKELKTEVDDSLKTLQAKL